jgi:chitinase
MPKSLYYFPAWGIYGRGFYPVAIPNHVNAVTYSFLDLKPNAAGFFVPTLSDKWADVDKHFSGAEGVLPADGPGEPYYGCLGQFRKIKQSRPLEFSLSIGGWTFSKNFSDAVLTPQAREAFVDTLVDMLSKQWPGLVDVLDFDWEVCSTKGTVRARQRLTFTPLF